MVVSRNVAKEIVIDVFDIISDAIVKDDYVMIHDFGTFKRKLRKPTKRMDINNGVVIDVPAKTVVSFIMAQNLAEMVSKDGSLVE